MKLSQADSSQPSQQEAPSALGEPAGPDRIRTIAVIGAGPTGRHFASSCLRAGLHVILEDVMPSNLRRAEADLLSSPGRLTLSTTVEDAVRDADLAIDFVPDELESKLEIFSMIDRMAPPRTILCTPTEVLSITDLASCVYRPERSFALRGLPFASASSTGAAVQLLYPPSASAGPLEAVQKLLSTLGFEAQPLPDPDAPVLLKNLP